MTAPERMKQLVYILFLICISHTQLMAQSDTLQTAKAADSVILKTDSLKTAKDSTPVKKKIKFEPVPKRAGIYASIFPGLGHIYIRQYWKLPIVYAAMGAGGYFIAFNLDKYRTYRKAYVGRLSNPNIIDEFSDKYSTADLQKLQQQYRQNTDIMVLVTAVGYSLQIMDAVASAHLRNFDISRDISMQVKPAFNYNFLGVGLAFNFK